MLSPETLKADFDKASSVWGGGVSVVGGNLIPGYIEDRTDLVETEEGVVERNYKVLVTTAALPAKTRVSFSNMFYTTSGAPSRDGVYEYTLREDKTG